MRIPAATAAAISSLPGSEMVGVPASDTSADAVARQQSINQRRRLLVLVVRVQAGRRRRDRVARQQMRAYGAYPQPQSRATSRSTRSARTVMSSRLPIGVATTKRVPVGKPQVSSLRSRCATVVSYHWRIALWIEAALPRRRDY